MEVDSSPPASQPAPGTLSADRGGNLDSVGVLSPPPGLYLESLPEWAPGFYGPEVGLPNVALTSLRFPEE